MRRAWTKALTWGWRGRDRFIKVKMCNLHDLVKNCEQQKNTVPRLSPDSWKLTDHMETLINQTVKVGEASLAGKIMDSV